MKQKVNIRLKRYAVLGMLCMSGLTAGAADADDILEYQGDRYVIHVDKMHPDSEMTLLDVLNTCPEFLSLNGKGIDQDYKLRIDNIDIYVDPESFLANVKACEIDRIQICGNTSVAKAVNGIKGIIDIYYRNDVKTDGKVALTGSTYGNGKAHCTGLRDGPYLIRQGLSYGREPHDRSRIGRKSAPQPRLEYQPKRPTHHQGLSGVQQQ